VDVKLFTYMCDSHCTLTLCRRCSRICMRKRSQLYTQGVPLPSQILDRQLIFQLLLAGQIACIERSAWHPSSGRLGSRLSPRSTSLSFSTSLSLPSEHSSRQRYLLVPRRLFKILLIVGASSGVGLGFLK
jgi:hypothetical protein